MPKPGWTTEIVREKRSSPYGDPDRRVTEEVARITWTAKTPADYLSSAHDDEFALNARLPVQAGPLYWPVSQICEEGRVDWNEEPHPGQNPSDLKTPAAWLDLLPASPAGHPH